MKLSCHVMALVGGLSCWVMSSCNPEDPSAQHEWQKALDEARAKNNRLETTIAELKAAPPNDDSAEKAALVKEVARLKTELAAANAKVIQATAARTQEIKKKEPLVTKDKPGPPPPGTPAMVPTIVKKVGERAPIIMDGGNGRKPQTRQPAPPAPVKPRPNYDIPLKDPMMGPNSR